MRQPGRFCNHLQNKPRPGAKNARFYLWFQQKNCIIKLISALCRCISCTVRCGSFAAPLYGENAADASVFTLNLTAGRGALLHCFCAVPDNWQTLELTYHPDFAAGRSVTFTVNRSTDHAVLGVVPTSPAEVGSVVDL